jgi:hypothetical protein
MASWTPGSNEIERRPRLLADEKGRLEAELVHLRTSGLRTSSLEPTVLLGTTAGDEIPATDDARIGLFVRLFRCRESVYARLWET